MRNSEISFYLPISKKGASRFCSESDDTECSVGSHIRKRFAERELSDVIAILKLGDHISEEHTRVPVTRRPNEMQPLYLRYNWPNRLFS